MINPYAQSFLIATRQDQAEWRDFTPTVRRQRRSLRQLAAALMRAGRWLRGARQTVPTGAAGASTPCLSGSEC